MLPTLPQDKANHALYGALVCSAVLLFAPPALRVLVCTTAVLAVAAAKEIWDAWRNYRTGEPRHGVEWVDAAATVAGGAVVLLPWVA